MMNYVITKDDKYKEYRYLWYDIYILNIIFYLDYGNSYKNTFGQGPKGNTKMCKHILLNDKIVGKFLF